MIGPVTLYSYQSRYGKRLQRLTVDGGFTCPNRDGTLSAGGCTFCDNEAFHPPYTNGKTITEQLEAGIAFHGNRSRTAEGYLAYFQPFSNTYADPSTLARRYEEALSFPGVCGLVIGTRPDCMDRDKLRLLAGFKARGAIVELEFGIESVYDSTLRRVNRGHGFTSTRKAFEMAAEAGFEAGGHLILGLPGETREMMVASADILNSLPVSFLKFHQLQLLKGTPMELEYKEKPGDFFRPGPREYISLLADILERLRPDIAIGRIVSSVPPRYTDTPWGLLRPEELMNGLVRCLNERNSRQGRLYRNNLNPTTI